MLYYVSGPSSIYSYNKVQLDGLNLLVQSKVYGVERCDSASGKEVSACIREIETRDCLR